MVNENREGYKKTKLGWIPNDWELMKLGSLGEFLKGKGISKKELVGIGIPAVRYGEIYTIHHYYLKKFYSFINQDTAKNSRKLKKGDLLFASSGESVEEIGKCVANLNDQEVFAGGDIIILRNHSQNSKFMGFMLNHEICNRQKYKLGQGNSIVHIYSSGLKKVSLPLPPLPEQKKIAQILSTWDKAIEQTQDLIKQLQLRKKGLMQQLLTGEKRLPGFEGKWEEVKLGYFFDERKERGFDDLQLLSVGKNGVYPQNNSVKKDTSNSDKSKYKKICVGDIGYNTMRMWQGRSALSHIEGIVSPAYTIVCPKENADSLFFSFLFKLEFMIHKFYRNSQGMVSDTWMCKFKDFSIIKILAPTTKEEQVAVSKMLLQADEEIKARENYLETLQAQKKGLMQQLLTGQKRVKITA